MAHERRRTTTAPPRLTTLEAAPGLGDDRQRLADLLPDYERYLHGEKRSPEGIKRYLWGLKRAFAWLEGRIGRNATNADLTFDAVQDYKEHLGGEGFASSTIINALAALKDFAEFAVVKRLRWDDPTVGVRRPTKRRPDPNPLYEEDIAALIRSLDPRERAGSQAAYFERRNRIIVFFFLYTGLRLKEVANLRRQHIKLQAGLVEVRHGKNDRDRTVALHPHLIDLLAPLLTDPRGAKSGGVFVDTQGAPLGKKGLAHIFDTWLPRRFAALESDPQIHVYAHRLRHTFASMLVWNDENLRVVQELLGHAQLGTTEHYTKVARKQKRRAIRNLPRLDEPLDFA